jgi:hypothetical protein
VQLTWLANYEKAGLKVGAPIWSSPRKRRSIWTWLRKSSRGHDGKLVHRQETVRITPRTITSTIPAPKIANGTDQAGKIAGYVKAFETALRAGSYIGQAPKPLEIPAAPSPALVKAPARCDTSRPCARFCGEWRPSSIITEF